MIFSITSSKNEKFKYFKALKSKKSRMDYKKYTVEGIKSVSDALAASRSIFALLLSESFSQSGVFEIDDSINTYIISDEIFASLSSTETPQGIIAVINMEEKNLVSDVNKAYIYCDRIQDPGNLGTIIRTADAAGFGGVLMSEDCVDLYNPKTVRSSMGSFFHTDVYEDISTENLKELREQGFSLVCGVLTDNTVEYTEADFKKPVIIIIGNEANGICEEILKLSDINIKIPIDGKAESLNAAVAAAVIMYEVRRQRKL